LSGVQVSTNAVSTIPTVPITPRRTVVQPTTWYTCPAGKKAIVKGKVTCTGTGAGAEGRFVAGGTIMYRWTGSAVTGTNVAVIDDTATYFQANGTQFNTPLNVFRTFEVQLAAGETIQTTQDSGTNAEFNVFAEVQESPA